MVSEERLQKKREGEQRRRESSQKRFKKKDRVQSGEYQTQKTTKRRKENNSTPFINGGKILNSWHTKEGERTMGRGGELCEGNGERITIDISIEVNNW